jgi:hypothetical protein
MPESSVITINAVETGWLEMRVASSAAPGGAIVIKLPAASCDPLGELSAIFLDIAALYNPDGVPEKPDQHFYIFWEVGPLMYSYVFSPENRRRVGVELTCCSDIYAGIHMRHEVKFSAVLEFNLLARNLYLEMRNILRQYGLAGYCEKWQKQDFPISVFLKIYQLATGNAVIYGDFASELKALQEILNKKESS